MKKVAGTLKLDQAQFRELEAFSKFGSDLDAATMAVIDKGRKNVELLKQGLHAPLRVEQQIAVIYCGTKGLLKAVPIEKVKDFEGEYLKLLDAEYAETLQQLAAGELNDEITKSLEKAARSVVLRFIDKDAENESEVTG